MKNIKSVLNGTKVRTGMVRFSYANVWEPKGDGEDKKYSVALLILKEDELTINNIKKAMKQAHEDGINTKFQGKGLPEKNIYAVLHDGDEERSDDPVYKGCYYINASGKTKPEIVDKKRNIIEDTTEFYSGCYGLATLNFYAYNSNGKKGIACGLNNLMKIEDGEPLGGRTRAQDDFADLDFGLDEDDLPFDVDDDLF